jgi:hypothetical protein
MPAVYADDVDDEDLDDGLWRAIAPMLLGPVSPAVHTLADRTQAEQMPAVGRAVPGTAR